MNSETSIGNASLDAARSWINAGPKQLLIDGRWINSASQKTFEVLNPTTEQILCHVAEADQTDVTDGCIK
ncbi:hypothetical protein BN2476_300170 [Paraburkholderia piptadeniae]|uniref:Aldehyde dehydrogenase domain-containing protein n=1 Tax=Paraburkholderia piptadeniae TaxID=1701573 RepID=A0A1N7S2Y1_9BURK|nr:hypothetical protein BN2476_300170 [Paraburkholderia piptadeniae]